MAAHRQSTIKTYCVQESISSTFYGRAFHTKVLFLLKSFCQSQNVTREKLLNLFLNDLCVKCWWNWQQNRMNFCGIICFKEKVNKNTIFFSPKQNFFPLKNCFNCSLYKCRHRWLSKDRTLVRYNHWDRKSAWIPLRYLHKFPKMLFHFKTW